MSLREQFEQHRFDPVTESAVRIRLDPLSWPAELDSDDLGLPKRLSRAFIEAQQALTEFTERRKAHAANGNLSPAGIKAANAEWARKKLPDLERRIEEIASEAEDILAKGMERLTADFMGVNASAPTEPADIAMAQEIRAWLRSLPDQERQSKVRTIVGAGDKGVPRALLSAPSYLSGIDPEMVTLIRDDLVRKAFPERHAKLDAARKGAEVALRALDGVVRYVGHETETLSEIRLGSKPATSVPASQGASAA